MGGRGGNSGMTRGSGYENEILVSRGNAIKYKYLNGTLIGTIVRGR